MYRRVIQSHTNVYIYIYFFFLHSVKEASFKQVVKNI